MQKVYFLLLGLFLFSGVNAQIINFPDANFKAKLLAISGLDTNSNGEIEQSEALARTSLNLANSSITSLIGISYFSNLKYLYCEHNQISSLDLSNLIDLRELNCNDNLIPSLNISALTSLQILFCGENQLTSLDVSGLVGLYSIVCRNNQITSLDVTDNVGLYELFCENNLLTTIDASKLIRLDELDCSNNIQLTDLNVKNGISEIYGLGFANCPNLNFICVDESQLLTVQNQITTYGYTNCNVNSYCSFIPEGTSYTMQGNNRYDSNNSGCDASDLAASNFKFSITDGTVTGSSIANASGNYSIPVIAGTHTITPILETPTYFTISPTSATVTFPTQASPFTQDFCITANGVHPDLEVSLLPTTPARPGFDAPYKIIYKNKGTTTQSGSINVAFDDAVLDFISASPVTTNQTVNNLSWDFINILPFETKEITLTLNINSPMETPAVNGGDILDFTTTITSPATDDTPNDNTAVFHQTVVNSFDPNDKTCIEGTTITPAMVGEYVHYVIRFENTGTFPAENIVVKDMIDLAKFDINTLVPIKGSHEFVTNITSGNKVEFIFENINLPFDDANNDGFVAFKIKTKSSLVLGDTFSNSANIYFDYNFPIVTNTYTTTVQTLGKPDFDFAKYFTVYPNPASGILNLAAKNDIVVNSIAIYNILGQLVIAIPNAQSVSNIDVSNLKTGNYFIKMTTDKGTSNSKFIKE